MAHFGYLSSDKSLVSPYGATMDIEIAQRLTKAKWRSEAAAIIEELGHPGFNEELETRFVALLTAWLGQQNEHIRSGGKFKWRHPIPFLWNFRQGETYNYQEPIVRLVISRETHFYDGDVIHQVDKTVLRIIEAQAE